MRPLAPALALAAALLGPPAARAQHREHHHHRHRDHVRVECPVAMEDPGLVLARVGATTVTACDLAIARAQRVRAGLDDDPRRALAALVDEALLAEGAAGEPPRADPELARALAEAVVRAEALALLQGRRPTDDEVERRVREHPELAVREARVHLRQLVFGTQAEAAAAIEALRAGAPFEELLARSVDPLASRDGGDLGLLTAEGAQGVPPAVVAAGFALTEAGAVAPSPVEAPAASRPAGSRRRPRARAASAWHVVQLVERFPEERVPEAELRRRMALRMLRDRYTAARAEARARLEESLRPQARAAVEGAAIQRVRVAP